MIGLDAVNAMDAAAFVGHFGDVAEHAPWVAERAAGCRPFATLEAMIEAFHAAIRQADAADQLRLIRAHPDLATRASVADGLAAASRQEQAAAGLDKLTADEFACFSELNRRYRARFAIPFIFAVKGATKQQILAGYTARLGNDRDTEYGHAIDQICRIVGFRLAERVASERGNQP